MCNSMNYLIISHSFKPKYYRPYGNKKDCTKGIEHEHIAQFYRVMMTMIFSDKILTYNMFSTQECLDTIAIGTIKEINTQYLYTDLYQFIQVVDDQETNTNVEQYKYLSS